jgi:hypothetical protein
MAGRNQNITKGKGKVFIEVYDPGTTTGHGEQYFAQTTEFNLTVASETQDAYDADEGINTLIEQALTQVDASGSLITQDMNMDKWNLFVLGLGAQTVNTASATGSTQTLTDVRRGRYFQLGVSAGTPTGVRKATVTSVTKGGTPVTASGNWTQTAQDIELGRIYIELAAPGIADDDDLVVTYNVAASTRTSVVSKDRQVRCALRFVSANTTGDQTDFYMPLVNLIPDGDAALKGADWQTLGFRFTCLKRDQNTERVYIDGRAA